MLRHLDKVGGDAMFWKKNNNNANTAPASKAPSYSSVKIHPSVDQGVVAGAPNLTCTLAIKLKL